MAKKNYQKIDAHWKPSMTNDGSQIAMTFVGINSNGTSVKITMRMQKGAFPGMMKDVMDIFKADAAAMIRAVEKMKEAAA